MLRVAATMVGVTFAAVACGVDTDSSAGAAEEAGLVEVTLTASPADVRCGESLAVRVDIAGMTGSMGQAQDIVLVLDRSGSMVGQPLADMKSAASNFVDIVDQGTDGILDGVIGGGSRIGVVSFADNATLDRPLTNNSALIKTAIDNLIAAGQTNHEAGINTGQAQLAGSTSNPIMIILTDGQTTVGGNPTNAAAAAKAAGTTLFGIGLGIGVNQAQIRAWVSAPIDEHAFFTSDSGTLDDIFAQLGAIVTTPAATHLNAVLNVNPRFTVGNAGVTKGTVGTAGNTVTWSIEELVGETVSLTFDVTHDARSGGVVPLLASFTYTDDQGHAVMVANPEISVRGCVASLVLDPDTGMHLVGEDHTVIATVLDDFGDPVEGISVDFGVAGGASSADGDPSEPTPSAGSGVTDAAGATTFTYTNGEAALDLITATVPVQPGVQAELTDVVEHQWVPRPIDIKIKVNGCHSNSHHGFILVVLHGDGELDFDLVDESSILFGDAPDPIGDAELIRSFCVDHNRDRIPDRLYKFRFRDTHLDVMDTDGCLAVEIDGLDHFGCDDVRIHR